MIKGAESKELIYKKLMEVFPNAFMADAKTMRIPMKENGEVVEIKVALTAAKDILGGDAPTETLSTPAAPAPTLTEPSEQEKQNVVSLLERLGMKKEN